MIMDDDDDNDVLCGDRKCVENIIAERHTKLLGRNMSDVDDEYC